MFPRRESAYRAFGSRVAFGSPKRERTLLYFLKIPHGPATKLSSNGLTVSSPSIFRIATPRDFQTPPDTSRHLETPCPGELDEFRAEACKSGVAADAINLKLIIFPACDVRKGAL